MNVAPIVVNVAPVAVKVAPIAAKFAPAAVHPGHLYVHCCMGEYASVRSVAAGAVAVMCAAA